MALLNLTAAARAAGINRSTITRALKSGRLSATTNAQGERCIDTAELIRVFGPLQSTGAPDKRDAIDEKLVELLQAQLHLSQEREREGRERETRLLAMLEAEQLARRELETRLLTAPKGKKGKREK